MSAPTAPTIPVLGASTVVRKWVVEVDTTPDTTATFTPIGGVTNCVFKPDAANLEDDSDFDSGGAGSQTKTAGSASIALTCARKVQAADATAYDVGQEFLRSKAIGQYGPDNSVKIRIYEFTPSGGPRIEAYTGNFAVEWDPQGGGNVALDSVQVMLAGQGACAPITHPFPGS